MLYFKVLQNYKILFIFVPKIRTEKYFEIFGTHVVIMISILMFNLSFHGY